jgi:hypothetical protein
MTAEDLAWYAKTFGTVLFFLALCFLAIWSPRVNRRWVRRCLRVTGLVASLPGLLALFLLVAFPRYVSVSTLASPDGRFICYVKEGGSGATSDWTRITLRRKWRLLAQEVYFTEGTFDPHVHWADEKNLVIRYPVEENPTLCLRAVTDIGIECQPAPRSDFYPLEILKPKTD